MNSVVITVKVNLDSEGNVLDWDADWTGDKDISLAECLDILADVVDY